jgi:hypothetical protein
MNYTNPINFESYYQQPDRETIALSKQTNVKAKV